MEDVIEALKKSSKLFITVAIIIVLMSYGFVFTLGAVIF